MTSWIVLIALVALFTLAVRHGRATQPPVPPGYDGDRMLAEWRALGRPRLF